MPESLQFSITHHDSGSHARVGRVSTVHGSFDTPAFMPVGTQATVKGLWPEQVAATGAQIILGNTYHLLLRPGSELVARRGGLHPWMKWPAPILTDSGGFQVFSLSKINRITDQGVIFQSHLDGQTIHLTPEKSIHTQNQLGADIIMAFDDCPPPGSSNTGASALTHPHGEGRGEGETFDDPGPSMASSPSPPDRTRLQLANERTLRWLQACIHAHQRPHEQSLFGIVQGGTDLELRTWCASRVTQFDLPGYAIGGVAVGEGYAGLKSVVEHTAPLLPPNKPRYLMGVGYERDIVTAVQAGVDMFDCVLPTRNGRNASAFTSTGSLRLRNARFAEDDAVIEAGCDCAACAGGFSRSYLRHLFMAEEMLGPILVSLHNLRHFQRLMLDIRRAIVHNDWSALYKAWPIVLTREH